MVKKTQLPSDLTASGNLRVALVEGRSGLDIGRVDVSDREVRMLGVVYGADAGFVVQIPLVDSSRYIHAVVESGKVDAAVSVSGQVVRAEQYGAWPVKVSGEVVDISDRETRLLGAVFGADEGFVVRIPLVDASRHVHTVVVSGKVLAEQYGAWPVKVSGETVIADISGRIVRAQQYGTWPVQISGQTVTADVSNRSGRELGTVDVRSLDWGLGSATFWSGNIVNPGDNAPIGVSPYTRNSLYIRSHSGEMGFRLWLHDGYEYMEMETKTFSGDMIWTVEHVTPTINLQALSSGMVTARVQAARW